MAPMLVPVTQSIGMRNSCSTLSTPTCAAPRAPPPESTRQILGRWPPGAACGSACGCARLSPAIVRAATAVASIHARQFTPGCSGLLPCPPIGQKSHRRRRPSALCALGGGRPQLVLLARTLALDAAGARIGRLGRLHLHRLKARHLLPR